MVFITDNGLVLRAAKLKNRRRMMRTDTMVLGYESLENDGM